MQFAFVEQQFAVALGGVVEVGAEAVFGDVHLAYKQLVAYKGAVGIGEIGLSVADGLNLCAGQHDACSIVIEQKVFIFCPFVLYLDNVLFFHIRM